MEQLYDKLIAGCGIRVAFGSKGSQIAVVHDRTRSGNVRAYKYSSKQRRWKGPVRIYPSDVISGVSQAEISRLPAIPA